MTSAQVHISSREASAAPSSNLLQTSSPVKATACFCHDKTVHNYAILWKNLLEAYTANQGIFIVKAYFHDRIFTFVELGRNIHFTIPHWSLQAFSFHVELHHNAKGQGWSKAHPTFDKCLNPASNIGETFSAEQLITSINMKELRNTKFRPGCKTRDLTILYVQYLVTHQILTSKVNSRTERVNYL